MGLATPQNAILSAVIFNALIIVALIPLALGGVRYRALGAAAVPRRHLWIYGVGGVIIPFPGHQDHRHDPGRPEARVSGGAPMTAHLRPALMTLSLFTLITGVAYPLFVTGVSQAVFPARASGSLIVKDGKVVGSALIGAFDDPKYFWGRPSATNPALISAERAAARSWTGRRRGACSAPSASPA